MKTCGEIDETQFKVLIRFKRTYVVSKLHDILFFKIYLNFQRDHYMMLQMFTQQMVILLGY